MREAVRAMMEVPFQKVKDDMVRLLLSPLTSRSRLISLQKSGSLTPSYTSMLLDECRDSDGHLAAEDEEDIKGSAGTLFAGGRISSSVYLFETLMANAQRRRTLYVVQPTSDISVASTSDSVPVFRQSPS